MFFLVFFAKKTGRRFYFRGKPSREAAILASSANASATGCPRAAFLDIETRPGFAETPA
jgi:hypothetical protein